ncbi:hypothetical protein ABKP09_24220 [Peribacillus frigoritolerans]|uniref:hypothetical protein n=1 Tax=Peribacillus frigoritolerans TaxID=450367 RepID=UPI0032B4B0B2
MLDKKSKKINLNDVDMTDVEVVSTENIDINEYFRKKLLECIAKEESRLFLYKEKNK